MIDETESRTVHKDKESDQWREKKRKRVKERQ